MSINIKNERVSQLAVQLAEKTGESITDAVGKAIEEKIQRLERSERHQGLSDKLMEIGKRCAEHAPKDWLTWDYDADLYDDKGLPR